MPRDFTTESSCLGKQPCHHRRSIEVTIPTMGQRVVKELPWVAWLSLGIPATWLELAVTTCSVSNTTGGYDRPSCTVLHSVSYNVAVCTRYTVQCQACVLLTPVSLLVLVLVVHLYACAQHVHPCMRVPMHVDPCAYRVSAPDGTACPIQHALYSMPYTACPIQHALYSMSYTA
eukprot:scpid33561/ scgid24242/ 